MSTTSVTNRANNAVTQAQFNLPPSTENLTAADFGRVTLPNATTTPVAASATMNAGVQSLADVMQTGAGAVTGDFRRIQGISESNLAQRQMFEEWGNNFANKVSITLALLRTGRIG